MELKRFSPDELPGLPWCHLNAREIFPYTPPEQPHELPLMLSRARAGFPSPADDYVDQALSLDRYCVQNEAATFFVRVEGASMTGAGIDDGDLLVVDRSLEPRSGDIVVAALCGEITVKRYLRRGPHIYLAPEHEDYPTIRVTEGSDMTVWGVVVHAIKTLRR